MPETTIPDTAAYLWLGLGVIALIMSALIARFWLKYRSLKQDQAVLEQITQS
ncbi:MAG: hypothetical protein IAE89_14745 [Anaerolineae bacterium]|nr:hypothetical protein [Anaerolineae bacterium]